MERNAIKQSKIARVCGHKIPYGHLFLSSNKSFRYFLILFHWEGVPNLISPTGNERGDLLTLKRTDGRMKEDFYHEDKRVLWKIQGAKGRRKQTGQIV